MTHGERPLEEILRSLQERAKELTCLYRVDEILGQSGAERDEALREVLRVIPDGWQYPRSCTAKLVLDGRIYQPAGHAETRWSMSAPVRLQGETIGELTVYYTEKFPLADEGPFLKEERRLLNAIVERIGYSVMQRRLRHAVNIWHSAVSQDKPEEQRWDVILSFLRNTDPKLLQRITRRMINHLCVHGVHEGEALLQRAPGQCDGSDDENRPQVRRSLDELTELTGTTFRVASREMGEREVLHRIQDWIKEDKTSFLYEKLERLDASLPEIADAVARYRSLNLDRGDLPVALRTGLSVALLRRFFSDRLDHIEQAKRFVEVDDFYDLVQRVVWPPGGHGKLGGKSAGLFLATQVVRKSHEYDSVLSGIKVPRTWYVTSDALLQFIRHNDMEDVYNCKYREVDQIRLEYPHLVQVFKNSPFPPEIVQGLSLALDEFGEQPIIVRSSSLLEDHSGSTFSGKYKSLFLANQGTKTERLAALQDAIAEVYASVFSPDPIQYRAERGLLDVHEEMAIMIQEVVGTRVGGYFLPSFSGVAFSRNDFRWSPRIRREDGLVRLVPGLGTRAVDRLSDDYPILVAPGQAGLRVNASVDEVARYSPRWVDLINLETNRFETVDLGDLLRAHGNDVPLVHQMVSRLDSDRLTRPLGKLLDFERESYVVTFEGLFGHTSFLTRMRTLLRLLEDKLGRPVDIEFASDGTDFYLLQCRPQSHAEEYAPSPIPRDLPRERVLFTARRHVSNGRVADLTHIVYVDPQRYEELPDVEHLRGVARAVGRLNSLLPKRQFVLMGPGRWGSRGDIKLGVPVTYADINNTAMLLEIARDKGGYVPEVSFGTHFFQDLVEAQIRYLPLYPDEEGSHFNEPFLRLSSNLLPELLPEYTHLAGVLHVIDVPHETGGRVLRVLLNADLDEAAGVFVEPTSVREGAEVLEHAAVEPTAEEHWRWRLKMAERIAAQMDADRFAVRGVWVVGSTKNATAGPASDLDLLLHFTGDGGQRRDLLTWLEGWNLALAEMNYLRTGYHADPMLDVHLLTDEDFERQTSFAAKIGAITDAARALPLGTAVPRARPADPA
jgi:hypothetical protein